MILIRMSEGQWASVIFIVIKRCTVPTAVIRHKHIEKPRRRTMMQHLLYDFDLYMCMGNCLEGAEMKHGMLNKNDMWSQFHSSCLPCYILNTHQF